jgi:predicted transcriptional regulator
MRICTEKDAIATIDLDECLGLSLATINTNFQLLKEANCFTTEERSSKQKEITDIQLKINSLSADLLKIPKALVTFDGTTNPVSVINSLRVKQVSSLDTGVYRLSFDPPFNSTDYAVIGTCFSLSATSDYTWVHSTTTVTSSSTVINIRNEDGVFINPNYVSITIFNT